MRYLIVSIFIMILGFSSCRTDIVSPKEFGLFMVNDNNGLSKTIDSDSFTYKLSYRPNEGEALRKIKNNLSKERFSEALKSLDGHLYFLLEIRMKNGQNINNWMSSLSKEQQNELRFGMEKEFTVEVNGEYLPCQMYHLEEMGLAGLGLRFFMVFENNSDLGDLLFRFDGSVFNNPIEVIINKKNLDRIPSIKF